MEACNMSDLAVELSLVLIGFGLYLAYHLWFFFAPGTSLRTADTAAVDKDLFNAGKIARAQFCEMICEAGDC